jgi:hypothetical protein
VYLFEEFAGLADKIAESSLVQALSGWQSRKSLQSMLTKCIFSTTCWLA